MGLVSLRRFHHLFLNILFDPHAGAERNLQRTRRRQGDQEDSRGYGADYHPNRAQAKLNGAELAAHLRKVVTEWDNTSTLPAPASAGARLVRLSAGMIFQNQSQVAMAAKVVDLQGHSTWSQVVPPSGSAALPTTRSVRWLVLESAAGSQVLPLQPDLR